MLSELMEENQSEDEEESKKRLSETVKDDGLLNPFRALSPLSPLSQDSSMKITDSSNKKEFKRHSTQYEE